MPASAEHDFFVEAFRDNPALVDRLHASLGASELRVELMFPADDATDAFFRERA